MKGGKNEEKPMGPMFPRLHINDADKGGPRAPPRNKMALYEQLSVPSQRFTSGSASMLPLPPTNSGNLVPSTSSSHGCGQKRNRHSPLCNSPVSAHLAEKFHCCSPSGMNLNTAPKNLEWRSIKPSNYQASNAAGHFSTATNSSFLQPHSISDSKASSAKKLGDEDDFRFPKFIPSGRNLKWGNGLQNRHNEKVRSSSPNRQLQTAPLKPLNQTGTAVVSVQQIINQTDQFSKISPTCRVHAKKPDSTLKNGDKVSINASFNHLSRGGEAELVKGAKMSLNEEKRRSLVDDLSRLQESNVQSHHKYGAFHEAKVAGEISPSGDNHDNHASPNRFENVAGPHEDQHRSLQVGERTADISDPCIMDSVSGVRISPDAVVEIIGQKKFWRARRAIVHQQKIFAVQVFELHRIIKVQRFFAASPELLLENKLYLANPSTEVAPLKTAPALGTKWNDDSQKPNHNIESTAENALGKPSLPSINSDTEKGINTLQSCSANPSSAPTAADSKPSPLCFHPPPGNQWLVPVMSPSEGLVYKPYTGPCPPTAGFMAPVYGPNVTPVGGDFLNTAYGIPASHHQGLGILPVTPPLGQTYFSPYGMPVMNPSCSSSAVEQMSPFTRARSNGQDNHSGDTNFIMFCESSFYMPNQKSGVNMNCVNNIMQARKESEVQASTASSPSEMVRGDALPLFPTVPVAQVSDEPAQTSRKEQQQRVIKVVPHNPRSASESAARIFRSIQEERRQCE